MNNIFYLIPSDGVGGVESLYCLIKHNKKHVKCLSIYDKNDNSLKKIFKVFKRIKYFLNTNVEVIICSLWPSYFVGTFIKCIKPKIKLVTFLHNDKNTHFFDSIFTQFIFILSNDIISDSEVTQNKRIPKFYKKKNKYVVSLKLKNINSFEIKNLNPNFCFWGRLNKQKNLISSIIFFNKVKKKYTNANFYIIGPDDGVKNEIERFIKKLNLNDSVHFLGALDFKKIKNIAKKCSFYISTSIYEGFGISICEAMQLGLVPIIIPSGESSRYCINNYNSFNYFKGFNLD